MPKFFCVLLNRNFLRLLNRIRDKILQKIADAPLSFSSRLLSLALKQKLSGLARGTLDSWFWDQIIFSKV
jgi:hypothetical protein